MVPSSDSITVYPISRWYLVVIVLLYIGLLTSFSLNVSLLLRRETRDNYLLIHLFKNLSLPPKKQEQKLSINICQGCNQISRSESRIKILSISIDEFST